MFETGYLQLGTIKGVPIRVHWSLPLGALIFGRGFVPGFWLAFFLLVLIHELGHAFFVRRYGHRVISVDIHGFGGLCRWQPLGGVNQRERSMIAWGGVIAQGLLYLATVVTMKVTGGPGSLFVAQVVSAFTTTNLFLIALNLIPISPFDGAEAWRIFGTFGSSRPRPKGGARGPFGSSPRGGTGARGSGGSGGSASAEAARRWRVPRPEAGKAEQARKRREEVHAGSDSTTDDVPLSNESQSALAELFEKISQEARDAKNKKN